MKDNIFELKPFIQMGAEKLREKLYLLINNADEKLLRMLVALGDVYEEEENIPMNPKLAKMTAEEMKARLDESRAQYERGEVHTMDEVKEMMKKW